MSITTIDTNELRRMQDKEGLILQGCGGDPQDWLDGINELLMEEKILLNGSKFKDCSVFKNGDTTCILYPFENVELNMGKLAVWRIASHDTFGGTWLSDYVPNKLGGFVNEQKQKPDCALIGENGNIFNLMGIAAKTLRENNLYEQSEEMIQRITEDAHSYGEALNIIGEYVNITSADEMNEDEGMKMSYE